MNKSDSELKIKELVESWAKAVREEDIDRVLAHHAEDMVMFDVPPPLQAKGIEAYKKTWKQFFSWTRRSRAFTINELEITADENVAFCHGIGECAGENSQGVRESLRFRLTIGLRKIDKEWVVTHEHHSVPSE